jgi:hypothetical protein
MSRRIGSDLLESGGAVRSDQLLPMGDGWIPVGGALSSKKQSPPVHAGGFFAVVRATSSLDA